MIATCYEHPVSIALEGLLSLMWAALERGETVSIGDEFFDLY